MKGSTYRRCYCRDAETGKPLGKSCPQFKTRKHGTYSIRQELPAREDGSRRAFNRAGYTTLKEAQADLDHIRSLLGIPDSDDPEGQTAIAEMLEQVADEKAPLPDIEETRRRFNTGQQLIGRLTVADWLDRWLAAKRVRKSTVKRYASDVRVHLKPRIGHLRIDRLRVSHIAEMFAAVEDTNAKILEGNTLRRTALAELAAVPWKGLENRGQRKAMKAAVDEMPPFRKTTGPTARRHIRSTLRAALNDAITEQIITFNPAAYVKLAAAQKPKALLWTAERVARWEETGEKPSPVMVWTPEQVGAFLDFVAEDRLYGMWHLIAHRGLRRGEACGQPWSETRLDSGSITVSSQLVPEGADVEESAPKTASGFRIVALDDGTTAALRTHRARQEAAREKWGEAWVDTGRVFANEDGTWLHPDRVTDLFERLVTTSGLPPIRLHDLRHVAATLMLAGGADMKTVQEMLGHSSITITMDIYASVLPELAKEAAEAAAQLVPRQVRNASAHASLTQEAS